jgi:hypothetical protein
LPFHWRFSGYCTMAWESFKPSPRDLLIHRVRLGEIRPEEAEIEAQHGGFGPLATKPNSIDFEPAQMPYWSLPMAVAWIAWRSIEQVREHCAEYRENWLHWFPGSWNVPTNDGKEFKRIDGYELRSSRQSTVARLALIESYLSSTETLPPTCQMTIGKAEKELLVALAAGRLVAVAKDSAGQVADIPPREWSYLHLFEEKESDVLKHDALDAQPAFTDVKLRQQDLQRLWEEFLVQPYMIEPMTRTGTAGYVPFCTALHWIMTKGGTVSKNLEDFGAWNDSVQRMLPLISTGEIQIVGRPSSGGPPQTITNETFAGVLVSHALRDELSIIVGEDPWISCTPYIDQQHWSSDFNDELYLVHYGPATWTHLQVRKSDVLREFQIEEIPDATKLFSYKSGAPGRPTSKHLVKMEFDARYQRGDAARSVKLEATALASWLGETHPNAPQLTTKTIENQIRSTFRNRGAGPQN